MSDWWEDKAIWKGFRKGWGDKKEYWIKGTAYLGGWSGHADTHGDTNVLIFRKDGIAYKGFRDKFVIPWDQVVAIDVEGPDSPSDRVTATRLATIGVFAFAAKKGSGMAAVLVELTSGEEAIFRTESASAAEVRMKLLPITTRLEKLAPEKVEPVGPPEVAAPPISVADEVMKLAQLRDQGIITEEQFEAQRDKLFG
jgi:hypothetical protein